jgi:KDO2-lipid IV(A) lauroyltransferase
MNLLIYWAGRLIVGFLQALPLGWVARLGYACGAIAFRLDARHRQVAIQNLNLCFGKEKSPAEIRAIARENYRRILEGYFCAVKTAAMTRQEILPHLEFCNVEQLFPPRPVLVALGHFGNFEIYSRFKDIMPDYTCATTYRALKQRGLNRLLLELRGHSGCIFLERRSDAAKLRDIMNQPGILVGLFVDQHGGARGIRGPFFGHDCSSNPGAAVFALRYGCELYTSACWRVGFGKWRLELSERVPTYENGNARPVEDIVRDINRNVESFVRRDPANWFWVHKRWKPPELPVKSARKEHEENRPA